MKLLDLFCGAGGAAMGYYQSGLVTDIVGVDHKPMPRYPFYFEQTDALEFLEQYGEDFDLIHASPPCQRFSVTQPIKGNDHPDLITPTRTLLKEVGKPYIIENVPNAPLENPLMLCGTMFDLRVIRHRLFEIWPTPLCFSPMRCNHWGKAHGLWARDADGKRIHQSFDTADFICVVGNSYRASDGRIAMGIDWMGQKDLGQAIPPAYTEWIGKQLAQVL